MNCVNYLKITRNYRNLENFEVKDEMEPILKEWQLYTDKTANGIALLWAPKTLQYAMRQNEKSF
ncbi:Pre-mRNA-processing-splicing factor 8 [Armadillidium nasatum]|uniref:Pre-mRNA-processing-splicing factor 8 n=1 Tax=Armadillidium nasatum TaxID=96803 RepID=A0A5N5TE60_9CRUS|nr:Pre-mRNA-processing-splicing factor 8 [Armadillidium nasatum]